MSEVSLLDDMQRDEAIKQEAGAWAAYAAALQRLADLSANVQLRSGYRDQIAGAEAEADVAIARLAWLRSASRLKGLRLNPPARTVMCTKRGLLAKVD